MTKQVLIGINSIEDITSEFSLSEVDKKDLENSKIVIGFFNSDDGCMDYAFILFEKNDKFYEVNDSHCSCYGFENWNPEETTKKALLTRLNSIFPNGIWKEFNKELREIIENLK